MHGSACPSTPTTFSSAPNQRAVELHYTAAVFCLVRFTFEFSLKKKMKCDWHLHYVETTEQLVHTKRRQQVHTKRRQQVFKECADQRIKKYFSFNRFFDYVEYELYELD